MMKTIIALIWMFPVFSCIHAQKKGREDWHWDNMAGINSNVALPQNLSDSVTTSLGGAVNATPVDCNVPKPNLGTDTVLCSGPITLKSGVDSLARHTWSNGSTGNRMTVSRSGTYWVRVETCGQILTDTVKVTFKSENVHFTMPKIITPNNDGMNDYINMAALLGDCYTYDLKIMNRWGYVVYDNVKAHPRFTGHSTTGNKLAPGVYYYAYTQGHLKKTGTITVAY